MSNFDLIQLIESYEQIIGSRICFHDFHGLLYPKLPIKYIQHSHKLCNEIKVTKQTDCINFDGKMARANLKTNPYGFWKCCHGGIIELFIPIRDKEKLLGILFCGLYKWSGKSKLPDHVYATDKTRNEKIFSSPCLSKLPEIKEEDMDKYYQLGQMLAFRIERYIVEDLTNLKEEDPRKNKIEIFFRFNFSKQITIKDLSDSLHISTSRTGQVLKDLYQKTFPAMLLEHRLNQAKKLLLYTNLKGAEVARKCGYNDAGYFYRIFKINTKETPLQFRKKERIKHKIQLPNGP